MASPPPQDAAVRAAPGRALYPGGEKAELAQTVSSLTAFAKAAIPTNLASP